MPAALRGPVLLPPCSRQRPFAMARALQSVPRRVLAPQYGAREKSPVRLPFLRRPRRDAWGLCSLSFTYPPSPAFAVGHGADNRLAAFMNVNMLDRHLLLSDLALQFRHRF